MSAPGVVDMSVYGPVFNAATVQNFAPDLRDRRVWIERNVIIQDKQRQRVPLLFNVAQQRLWSDWSARGLNGLRAVVHKARQEGVSTLVLAMILDELRHVPNTRAVIVDREAKEAHRKLDTLKFMYDNLPDDEKPRLHYNNRDEMGFPDLGSSVYVGKAGARKFGRGQTIHIVLLSEIAFYPDPESVFTGVMAAVPEDEGMVVLESTANGAETWWHNFYRAARDGGNDFLAAFLSWTIFPEYRKQALVGEPPLERSETERRPPFGALDDDQLRWYRIQQRRFGDKAAAEFPTEDEDGFLHSGRTRFDIAALLRAKAAAPKPIRVEDNGALIVYAEPVEGRTYSIGADTAEGLLGGDYDAAVVVDDATGIEVAVLWGSWPPHVYADKLAALGKRYTTARPAMIAVERNNHGHAVLQRLTQGAEGLKPYTSDRIYRHLDYDERTKKQLPRPGWPTDTVTKPILETGLERLLAEHPECFISEVVLSELMTIVFRKDGSVGAPENGGHDDLFIARGIAEQVRAKSMSSARGGGFTGSIVHGAVKERISPFGDVDDDYVDPRGE